MAKADDPLGDIEPSGDGWGSFDLSGASDIPPRRCGGR